MKTIRALGLAVGALSFALALAACRQPAADPMPRSSHGAGTASPSASSAARNSADVMFAQMMIPHHQQAIEMADMVLAEGGIDVRVRTLAQRIKDAQNPEIAAMRGWLADWGASAPDDMGMEGMGHGAGMMSGADMDRLRQAAGPDAARLFLEQMIQHHQGAVTMAQAEADNGRNAAAIDFARRIVTAQTSEIAEMQTLLSGL